LANGVLVSVEGQVTNKESIALRADRVAVSLGTVVGTVTRVSLGRASIGIVEVESTVVELEALHSIISLSGSLGVLKVDVSEASAAASITISDDTAANQALKLLESFGQGGIVNVPAQVASKQGSGSLLVSLGLLRGGVDLLISLALLGSRGVLGLGLGLVGLLRVVLTVVRVFLRVRGVGVLCSN
jgi:hypothetical protein